MHMYYTYIRIHKRVYILYVHTPIIHTHIYVFYVHTCTYVPTYIRIYVTRSHVRAYENVYNFNILLFVGLS